MRILITANSMWNIANFRLSLIRALMDDGHNITVLAPKDCKVELIKALGCEFIELDLRAKSLSPLHAFVQLIRFKKVFLHERPDIVLSFTIKNNILASIAAKSTGTKVIANVTGLGTAFLSGKLLKIIAEKFYRYAFKDNKIVFFQNHEDKDLFIHRALVTTQSATLLPGSGIDLTHFKPADYPEGSEAPIFLMISRVTRDKGVMEYVESARKLKKTFPKARFQILGSLNSGNRSDISLQTFEAWLDEGLIEYLGATEDVRPFIASAHCVVLPSYREGAPRSLIEAAAMARPIITTDVAGCRSVVDNGVNGLLCKEKDVADLVNKMKVFLSLSQEDKKRMGLAGRSKMECFFDEAIVISAYRRAIQSLRV